MMKKKKAKTSSSNGGGGNGGSGSSNSPTGLSSKSNPGNVSNNNGGNKVSWRTPPEANRNRTAREAQPESELNMLEGVLANVNANAGKKRQRGSLSGEEDIEDEHSENESENGQKLCASAGNTANAPRPVAKSALNSWLKVSEEKREKNSIGSVELKRYEKISKDIEVQDDDDDDDGEDADIGGNRTYEQDVSHSEHVGIHQRNENKNHTPTGTAENVAINREALDGMSGTKDAEGNGPDDHVVKDLTGVFNSVGVRNATDDDRMMNILEKLKHTIDQAKVPEPLPGDEKSEAEEEMEGENGENDHTSKAVEIIEMQTSKLAPQERKDAQQQIQPEAITHVQARLACTKQDIDKKKMQALARLKMKKEEIAKKKQLALKRKNEWKMKQQQKQKQQRQESATQQQQPQQQKDPSQQIIQQQQVPLRRPLEPIHNKNNNNLQSKRPPLHQNNPRFFSQNHLDQQSRSHRIAPSIAQAPPLLDPARAGNTNIQTVSNATAADSDDEFDLLACALLDKYENKSNSSTLVNPNPNPQIQGQQGTEVIELDRSSSLSSSSSSSSSVTNPRVLAPKSASFKGKSHIRFKIVAVQVNEEERSILCEVRSRPNDKKSCLSLRGCFAEVLPQVGDYANVIWSTPTPPDWVEKVVIIDDESHYFVLCPDLLVAPTRITASLDCVRRAVLSDQVNSFEASKQGVVGKVKHHLVERGFKPVTSNPTNSTPCFERQYLDKMVEEVLKLPEVVKDLFSVDLTEDLARNEMRSLFPALQSFHQRFIDQQTQFGAESAIEIGEGKVAKVNIEKVVSSEESIFSPLWGLTGQADLLVRGTMQNSMSNNLEQNTRCENVLFPLELKTGSRIRIGHEAQVQLYSLLLNDRYLDMDVAGGPNLPSSAGLLMHVSNQRKGAASNQTQVACLKGVINRKLLLRSLIARRNEYAAWAAPSYMRGSNRSSFSDDRTSEEKEETRRAETPEERKLRKEQEELSNLPPGLPQVLGNPNGICDNCFEKRACMTFHKVLENGSPETSGLSSDAFEKIVGNISPAGLEYFRAWDEMINLETGTSVGQRREIWTLSGPARESKGKCVSGLALSASSFEAGESSMRASFLNRFERYKKSNGKVYPSMNVNIGKGDFVRISIEGAHHIVRDGVVAEIGDHTVTVRTREPIPLPVKRDLGNLRFRLDKDERFVGMKIVKNSLIRILDPKNQKLAELIIDLKAPRYMDDEVAIGILAKKMQQPPPRNWLRENTNLPSILWNGRYQLGDARNYKKLLAMTNLERNKGQKPPKNKTHGILVDSYKELNDDQRKAVSKVLATTDYSCIHGMPGTGKTTTLAFIVQALRALGCSVLVCGYTHTAVDNLLIKLLERDVPFVRLGSVDSVHPQVRGNVLEAKQRSVAELLELENDSQLVVGATCLCAPGHPLVQKRRFDFCIIDEAGQLTQPVCFGPLCSADAFVLVGDDQQLPPLVKSELAKRKGMNISLLRRLSEKHPASVTQLTYQFRMNLDIMNLANELVYKGKLKVGSEFVSKQRLLYTNFPNPSLNHSDSESDQWLVHVLDPEHSVVFLDTDSLSSNAARERRSEIGILSPEPKDRKRKHENRTTDEQRVAELSSSSSSSSLSSSSSSSFSVIDVSTPTREAPPHRATTPSQSPSQSDHSALCSPTQNTPIGRGKDGKNKRIRGRLENETEAKICHDIVNGLVSSGISCDKIGVISPYRSQLRVLTKMLQEYLPTLEIQTVDRYQGRDKDCIIVSLVRSNMNKEVGELLKDWRRINVAFTRAKCKLLVVGSRETLEQSAIFSSFMKIVSKNDWVKVLPPRAHFHFPMKKDEGEPHAKRFRVVKKLVNEMREPNPILQDIATENNSGYTNSAVIEEIPYPSNETTSTSSSSSSSSSSTTTSSSRPVTVTLDW